MELSENPDILRTIARKRKHRPSLVIGFAAETNDVEVHALAKLERKGCDWIIANDVSGDVMGGLDNEVALISHAGIERWPLMSKEAVAARLAERIAAEFGTDDPLSMAAE